MPKLKHVVPKYRIASVYSFLVEKRPKCEIDTITSFADFLSLARGGVEWIQSLYSMKSQLDYFTLEDSRLKLDFLGHYEYLADDFRSVTQSLCCPANLRHHNRSSKIVHETIDKFTMTTPSNLSENCLRKKSRSSAINLKHYCRKSVLAA